MSPADPAVLAADPANRVVLAALEREARTRPADDPWALDGFELHAHPDLVERFESVVAGTGASASALYGVPVLVVRSRVVAVARGTGRIDLRLEPGPVRDEIDDDGGAASALGDGWISADAWLSHLPSAVGDAALRRWIAAAAGGPMVSPDA